MRDEDKIEILRAVDQRQVCGMPIVDSTLYKTDYGWTGLKFEGTGHRGFLLILSGASAMDETMDCFAHLIVVVFPVMMRRTQDLKHTNLQTTTSHGYAGHIFIWNFK